MSMDEARRQSAKSRIRLLDDVSKREGWSKRDEVTLLVQDAKELDAALDVAEAHIGRLREAAQEMLDQTIPVGDIPRQRWEIVLATVLSSTPAESLERLRKLEAILEPARQARSVLDQLAVKK